MLWCCCCCPRSGTAGPCHFCPAWKHNPHFLQKAAGPEMEFLNVIFSWGFWALTRVFSGSSFVSFSTLIFPSAKCFSWIDSSFHINCFVDLFIMGFKPGEEYGFLRNQPVAGTVNSMERKTLVFCQIYVQEFHLWWRWSGFYWLWWEHSVGSGFWN